MTAALPLLLALAVQPAQDTAHVSASLTAAYIAVGETTTLRIIVEARGMSAPDISVPALPAGLDLAGTSDFSQMRMSAPGQRMRSSRRELVLIARAAGSYTIGPVIVAVGGRTYRTAPLELTVAASSAASPTPRDDGRGIASATTLRLDAWPDTAYVGQQVLLEAEVTFAEDSRSRQSRPAAFEPPAVSGFWVQDLPDPINISLRVREGRTVESQTYRRAYFPLTPGELWFPPAHVHYELRRGFLQAPESRRIASDSLRLIVLPLPAADRPHNFTGAVGSFDVRASVAPADAAVGAAAVLTVELHGRGNVKALPEPRLPELDGFEVFAPTQESTIDVADNVVGGRKRFRWLLVPQRPGTLVIPPIEYSFFDPELRTYVTLHTDSLVVRAQAVAVAQPVDTLIRPLRAVPGREPAVWARSPWFAAAQLVPLLLVGMVAGVRRRRERPPGPREHAHRIRAAMTALRQQRADSARLAELERLLGEAVRRVAGAAGGDPEAALRAQGRTAEAQTFADLVAELRRGRYAPDAAADFAELLRRALAFVDSLQPRRRILRRAGGAGVLLLALIGAAALHAADAATHAFETARAHYDAGDMVAAANGFHDYARSNPRDAAGWYNLGVAAYQAGDPGRAVWAWLRAVRLTPRDADLRHNLHLTAASEAVSGVVPPDRLAAGERLAAGALAWWLLVLGAGLGSVLRRRRLWWIAAPAAVALLVLGTAAAATGLRPVVVTPLGQGTAAYAGPSMHDQTLAELPAGSTVRLAERRGDWLLVRLADGRSAWVERAAIAAP